MKEKVSLTLEKELLEDIDRARGMVPRSRWIEHKLKGEYDESGRGT